MTPEDSRIGAWVKTFGIFKKGVRPAYMWEPVVFWRGRNPSAGHKHVPPIKGGKQNTPKDFVITEHEEVMFEHPALATPITLKKGLTGAKPEKFCQWVLDLLNFQEGDTLVDMYPGTGVMDRIVAEVANGH